MEKYTGLEIAVIGMAGRFPGAGDLDAFWDNLKNGVESIGFFSDEELLAEGEEEDRIKDPLYVRANGFVKDKEYFDAAFFNYRPDEAALMDPQMRLFHECVWAAIEDAGCNLSDPKNKIGLFAGATPNLNWEVYVHLMNTEGRVDSLSAYRLSCTRFLPTTISYLLDLKGPSILLDTACSTSLVAIHQACRSLLLADCNMAVAGGVTITNKSKKGYLYQEGMIYSRDGHCRTFEETASGTVGGEGLGAVVLKTLKNAMKDGDHIWAVIKGSAINNDGNQKVGYTAPSIDGQTAAILAALKWAKIEPESIGYVEAHGTATRLGDPIEVEALIQAFGASKKKYCALGSVKTNIGHLDAAAGIAGLIKTILAVKNRQLPPSLHFKEPNTRIEFSNTPFYVNTTLKEWRSDKYPLRAGVSSFGIGGTNAHVIVEEPPPPPASSHGRDHQLLVLSAKTPTSLLGNRRNLLTYLENNTNSNLPDLAYTLQVGRTSFAWRQVIVCQNREEAMMQLAAETSPDSPAPVSDKVHPSVIFMFSGQGSQYTGMCQDLYRQEDAFRDEVDKCFTIVKSLCGKDLKKIVFPREESADIQLIDQTEYAQPLLFIMEYSLARLLIKWGIHPDSMIGHSIGEYVAACISGVFSLEDALYLVIKRGEIMQTAPGGMMLGIPMSEKELDPLLHQHRDISLATVNSTELCVVSGEERGIKSFRSALEKEGYHSSILHTSHAFHSWMMDGILEAFGEEVKKVRIHPQQIPFISNLSGRPATDAAIARPQYWVDHLRQTVRFSEGIAATFENPQAIFIEVGPGRSLSTFVRSNQLREKGHKVVSTIRHGKEEVNDQRYLLSALGELWLNGISPDWDRMVEKEQRLKVSLPTYAFDRIGYPVHVDAYRMLLEERPDKAPEREPDISKWFYAPSWRPSSRNPDPPVRKKEGYTLIFSDNIGIGDSLLRICKEQQESTISVKTGTGFRELSRLQYEIDPAAPADYRKLWVSLAGHGLHPDRIVHCWGITKDPEEDFSAASCTASFDSLLEIMRSCQAGDGIGDRQVVVVTNDLHPISDKEKGPAVRSLSLPLLKVWSQEYPSVCSSHIDISLSEEGREGLIEELCREIQARQPGKVVSLRYGQRWEQQFNNIKTTDNGQDSPLKEGGVYLVTGGLGKVGLALAGQLLKKWKARLILVGRTKLPDRDGWDAYFHSTNGRQVIKDKIRTLQMLEQQGGTVLYLAANSSVVEELAAAVRIGEEKFGRIDGVIHAAGIVDGHSINPLNELQKEDFDTQFEPKIKGLLALKEVMIGYDLDFCLLFSSLSAVLGGIGFGAYGPANIFMDYLVGEYRAKGKLKNWISINFDGIGFETKAIRQEEILTVIQRALTVNWMPQLVVSPTNLQKRLEKWVYREPQKEEEGTGPAEEDQNGPTADRLVSLWQSFFGRDSIGPKDDFFEMGGDSLKALTMIGRIYKALHVVLSVKDLFMRPTIQELSQYIDSIHATTAQGDGYLPIPKAKAKEYYPLSSAQKRLYFLYELDRQSLTYNIPWIMNFEGRMDYVRLSHAFNRLLERHEILRTAFEVIEGQPVQKILTQLSLPIIRLQAGKEEAASMMKKSIRPFDLAAPPLVRVMLIEISDREHMLMIDMHHIVTDGISYGLFAKELMALYKGEDPGELQMQYKDYSEWQHSEARQTKISRQREFLLKELSSPPPLLDLPIDFSRPAVRTDWGRTIHFGLSEEETVKLKSIAAQENVSMFVLVLSFYNILLRKLGNQDDMIIGTNTAGRHHPDLENILGVFVNTLPLRICSGGHLTYRECLQKLHSETLTWFENQDYQFEELIDELKIERDLSRNPLFNVLILYQNFIIPTLDLPDLSLTGHNIEETRSKFDLTLIGWEENRRLLFAFEYSTDLFRKETIDRFIVYLKTIITKSIEDLDRKISDI